MVVAVAGPKDAAHTPVFVFADEKAWQASLEWKEWADRATGPKVFIDLPSQEGSASVEDSVDAVRGAGVVVIGTGGGSLARWRDAGLESALLACFGAGGIIAGIGKAAALLGAWCSDGDGPTAAAGLVSEAVIGVCSKESHWDDLTRLVAKLHGEGHERVKGYKIVPSAGAAFFRAGNECRADAIGKHLMEAGPIPKSEAFGRLLKQRTLRIPDKELSKSLGTDLQKRWHAAIETAADWLLESQGSTVVSTGAGVSAESGIPTYRDEGGLWELYDQMEVSHIKGFARDPIKCWRFELELYQMLKHCGPNSAHKALAGLEKAGVVKTVITQNVDGLHVAAGSKDVIELHGDETSGICMKKGCRKTYPYIDVFRRLNWVAEDGSTTDAAPSLPPKKRRVRGGVYAELTDSSSSSSSSSSDGESSASSASSRGPEKFEQVLNNLQEKMKGKPAADKIGKGPMCPSCEEGLLKPNAVYFGEGLPKGAIDRAMALTKKAKAFLIVGTSGSVAPACKLPKIAKVLGAKVIEVSPRETDLSVDADLLFLGTATEVVPALLEAVLRKQKESSKADEETGGYPKEETE